MTNTDLQAELQNLHTELGLKRLNPVWAKVEILLGLLAASTGLLLGIHAVSRSAAAIPWILVAASVLLQTLGLYLTLAGHRSHLYQSQNKLIAWLAAHSDNRLRADPSPFSARRIRADRAPPGD